MTTTTTAQPGTDFSALKPRISYVAYHVNDIERALKFYVGVLGLKEQLRLPLGKGEHEVILGYPDNKGAGVILMWNTERTTPFRPGDAYSRFVLNVSNLDAAFAQLTQHGAPVLVQPSSAGSMRYAIVQDPDGYAIELLQVSR